MKKNMKFTIVSLEIKIMSDRETIKDNNVFIAVMSTPRHFSIFSLQATLTKSLLILKL